jgi:hypothetical protein
MKSNPYRLLNDHAFWKRSIAKLPAHEVDPVVDFPQLINRDTKVATAGSCFAQHIARRLSKSGFNYYVPENGHEIFDPETLTTYNYGTFSARYGNLYTARQLFQLFQRAFGLFSPIEPAWRASDGSYRDPFRPNIQPGGFESEASMLLDRATHLQLVRKMFETTDVFVFTMGLTECWRSKVDGVVFPICPGVEGGEYNSEDYEFYNQTVEDVVNDMSQFISLLTGVNPKVKVILTVSPVPLMATARNDAHVLSATTYSKSVLRVSAESVTNKFANVFYFPSYEIITGNFNRGQYYAEDLRSVLEVGVDHVMGLFFKYATDADSPQIEEQKAESIDTSLKVRPSVADVECDEELLDRDI